MAVSKSAQGVQMINQFNRLYVKKSQNPINQILNIVFKLNYSKLLTKCEIDNHQMLLSNNNSLIDCLQ